MMGNGFNDWALVSQSPFSPLVRTLALILIGAATFAVVWSYRRARRRVFLAALRIGAALLVAGIFLEPALELRTTRKIKNHVAMVVDRSASMALTTEEHHSRARAVAEALHRDERALQKLQQDHILDWYDLSGPISPEAVDTEPTGEHTDLVGALERAKANAPGQPLAGFVLFSDGADNVDLAGDSGTVTEAALSRLKALDAPVNTVLATGAGRLKDVAVVGVLADDFAFVHNTIEIEATIQAVGFGDLTLPVTLAKSGEVVLTEEVHLADEVATKVHLATKPDEIGDFIYTVSVPTISGDYIASNNSRAFALHVIRDKIRVLQVAGRPSWDERFLRQHLKENPNVDLISFFILRTPSDNPGADDRELSLIPFPTEKLFTTELRSFDVVIFQNFDYRPYAMAQYLPNIRDAVKAGLGFVMIGGEQSFAGGGYEGTALEEVIPIETQTGSLHKARVAPALTEAGRRHPVTDLTRDADNERVWKSVPPFGAFNQNAGVRPGAVTLVAHPSLRGADGKPMPLIAAMELGTGRALAIATDALWHWRFVHGRFAALSERAYDRFWANALRWLVRDPEHSRVQLLTGKHRYTPSEEVSLAVNVRGQDYQPVSGAQVTLTVTATTSGPAKVTALTTGDDGGAHARLTELAQGPYRATATAQLNGKDFGSASAVFVVDAQSDELSRAAPRPDLLRAVSAQTGGAALDLSPGALERVHLVDPAVVEISRRRAVDIWDNGIALAAIIALLAADWIGRRRSGYL